MVNNRPQQGPEETSPVVSIVRVSPAPKSTLPITGATGEETGTCSTHPCLLVSVARGHVAPTGGERCTEDELGGEGALVAPDPGSKRAGASPGHLEEVVGSGSPCCVWFDHITSWSDLMLVII